MSYSDLQLLKFNLQERQFPYFDDSELEMLLEQYGDVKSASYHGCMMKAQDDSLKLGPITTSSNKEYWQNLAKQFKPKLQYKTSMKRVDEI